MSDVAGDEHRGDQLSAVFALLTCKLEDAATLAAVGQGRNADHALQGYANQIAELANDAATIAGALAAILAKPETGPTE